MTTIDVPAIIDRLKDVLAVRTDAALGQAFGKKGSTVSNWRQRGTVPFEECAQVAESHGVSFTWLALGTGPRLRAMVGGAARYDDERLDRVSRFLHDWSKSRQADDHAWLEQQLARSLPDYAEWKAKDMGR